MFPDLCGFNREKVIVGLKILYLPSGAEIKTDEKGDPSDGFPILGGYAFEDIFSEPIKLKKNEFILCDFQYKIKVLRDAYILVDAQAPIGQFPDGPYSNGIEADLDNLGLHDTFDFFIKDKDFEKEIKKEIDDIINIRNPFNAGYIKPSSKKEQYFSLATVWEYSWGWDEGWNGPPEYDSEINFLGFLDFNSIKTINYESKKEENSSNQDITRGRKNMPSS